MTNWDEMSTTISKCVGILLFSLYCWFLIWVHIVISITLKLAAVCSMVQEVIWLDEYYIAIAGGGMYSAVVGWSALFTSCRSSWFIVLFRSPISLLVLSPAILSLAKEGGVDGPNCNYGRGYFSFQLYQFLLHMFSSSVVWWIHI